MPPFAATTKLIELIGQGEVPRRNPSARESESALGTDISVDVDDSVQVRTGIAKRDTVASWHAEQRGYVRRVAGVAESISATAMLYIE